jgi:hypothetical protein
MTDRFDLEEQIVEFSHILVDIDHLLEEVIEGEPTKDDISNVLLGLSALYDIKYRKLWRTFSELIRTHQLLSEPLDRDALAAEDARRKAFVEAMTKPFPPPPPEPPAKRIIEENPPLTKKRKK